MYVYVYICVCVVVVDTGARGGGEGDDDGSGSWVFGGCGSGVVGAVSLFRWASAGQCPSPSSHSPQPSPLLAYYVPIFPSLILHIYLHYLSIILLIQSAGQVWLKYSYVCLTTYYSNRLLLLYANFKGLLNEILHRVRLICVDWSPKQSERYQIGTTLWLRLIIYHRYE